MNRLDELRAQKLKPLGCVACASMLIKTPAEELHHILSGGERMGDWFTIWLCRGHHQGDHWHDHIPIELRVSLKHGRKAFTRVLPTEMELWERSQQNIGLSWPTATKIVPRVVA